MTAVRAGRVTVALTCDYDGCEQRFDASDLGWNAAGVRIRASTTGWNHRPRHGSHRRYDLCPEHNATHQAEYEQSIANYLRRREELIRDGRV